MRKYRGRISQICELSLLVSSPTSPAGDLARTTFQGEADTPWALTFKTDNKRAEEKREVCRERRIGQK